MSVEMVSSLPCLLFDTAQSLTFVVDVVMPVKREIVIAIDSSKLNCGDTDITISAELVNAGSSIPDLFINGKYVSHDEEMIVSESSALERLQAKI